MWKTGLAFVLGAALGFALAQALRDDVAPAVDGAAATDAPPATGAAAPSHRPGEPNPGDEVSSAPARRPGRAADRPAPAAGPDEPPASPGGDWAAAILRAIRAELDDTSPENQGMRALLRSQEFLNLGEAAHAPLALVRELFGRGGAFALAGQTLWRTADADESAAELRRLVADPAATWKGLDRARLLGGLLNAARDSLSDAEVRALAGSPDAKVRVAALGIAVARGLLGSDDLLRRVRDENAPPEERERALEGLAHGLAAGRGDRQAVVAEVLRHVRDETSILREAAVHLLPDLGPDGADTAAEVLAAGGLPPGLVDSVARGLAECGRFDALARAQVTGESLERLLDVLDESLNWTDEDGNRRVPRETVATTVRAIRLPESPDEAATYLWLAVKSGALEIPVRVSVRTESPAELRTRAVSALLDGLDAESLRDDEHVSAEQCVTAARAVLCDAPVPASARRELIESAAGSLIDLSDAGRALVRRVAESDPDPWVRRAAAEALSSAGD